MPRRLLVLLLLVPLAGCLELDAASVPDRYLEGQGGNGWEKDGAGSQKEPSSSNAGTLKTQTLVYQDKSSEAGYPGTLAVTTVRTLLRPSEESVREQVKDSIKEQVEAKGVKLEGDPASGKRKLANKAEAFWFSYNGSVESPGFFARNAKVKIFGEVFQCNAQKTVVVTVGMAQITDTKSIGGVTLPSDPDTTTWREIVADPTGTIEGVRGSEGLAYQVRC